MLGVGVPTGSAPTEIIAHQNVEIMDPLWGPSSLAAQALAQRVRPAGHPRWLVRSGCVAPNVYQRGDLGDGCTARNAADTNF